MPTPNTFTEPSKTEKQNTNSTPSPTLSPWEVTVGLTAAAAKLIIPSTKAAVIETASLHWLDTTAKRAQNHKGKIFADNNTIFDIKKVFLRNAAGKGFSPAMGSLYSGLGFGTLYKIGQRNLKFVGQKPLQSLMNDHVTSTPWLSNALAGSAMGGIEALLFTCLDGLKIKFQTDEVLKKSILTNYQQRGVLGGLGSVASIIRDEQLYKKGLSATLCRNIPGSFSLFAVPVAIKDNVYTWKPLQTLLGWQEGQLTSTQSFVANYAGSIAGILVPAPVDLTKTRQQAMSTSSQLIPLAKEIYAKEGITAFYKGAGIKLCTLGFKQAVFMTLFDYFAKAALPKIKENSDQSQQAMKSPTSFAKTSHGLFKPKKLSQADIDEIKVVAISFAGP
ncbi:MAG: MC/SLC25 family protein [Gammaproteobacteria bacterium]|nr:MC/SLC25 family protein [Gammaproteobacteria bacterium]